MRSINFLKLLEFTAILPILAICLACFYKYSFYEQLNLSWITSQLQLSGILLNAIPLFLEMFIGLIMGVTYYLASDHFIFGFQKYFTLITVIIILILVDILFNWEKGVVEVILDKGFLLYTFFIVVTVLFALENVGISRSILISFAIISLLLLKGFIDYKSYKEVKKLFYQNDSFSRVYFTEEGKKIIPTSFSVIDGGLEKKYELDWRLLELIGDKAIVIVSNRYELDGMKKPQVRIVEYKLIDRVY